jgi:signal transduction histidine kinase
MKILKRAGLIILFAAAALTLSAQKLSTEEHNKKIAALQDREKVDYIIANHYALYSADFENALDQTMKAAVIAERENWKDKQAFCEMISGVIYYLKGDFENALPQYLKAHRIFDSLKHDDGLARLCNEMAVFYRRHSDVKTAYQYLDQSEAHALKAGNKKELGTSYAHRANLLDREGKIKEAYTLYEKVYQIRLEQKDSVGLSYALLDLSTMTLRSGNVEGALSYIRQSTAIRKKIGDEQGVAVNLVNTGETYFSVKNYRKAVEYFEQCLALATKIGYTDLSRYAYEQLSASYVQLGDFRNAFLYQQKRQAFNDSLYTLEKASVIADLQLKYETERKEKQIVLQQAQLSEREAEIRQTYLIITGLVITLILLTVIFVLVRQHYKKQQLMLIREKEISVREAYMLASVQSQENERKRFAQDLHDGMGQLISALRLVLLSVNRNSTTEERIAVVSKSEGLLNEMHREIRSIAFNLMPQTLVLHGLVPALREMSERINTVDQINIRVNAFDIPERLTEVQEISLYRVIQEWINNIVKYSTAATIDVQLIGYPGEITVTVEDNGQGFDNRILETSTGNGWKNMKSRINLLKGELSIETRPGRQGTTIIIRIPVEPELKTVEKASISSVQ